MCAIAGFVNLPFEKAIADAMQDTMKRRGPDDFGYQTFPQCCLLHTRLAVIDPLGGKQPMHLQWGGNEYTITYNGELYNTEEIREQLRGLGHEFSGHSDTEVVLRAYAQWGEVCLQEFNGIFAFAVWEHKNNTLFLARDRMGVKPLFFMKHRGGFLFASEIKTILAYPNVAAEVDEEGIGEILLLGPGRTPGSGVFKNIYEIKPGYCGYYANNNLQLKRYWRLLDREHTDSFPDTIAKVRYLVTDAIQRQMVSDVPLGAFLSGGLDSSLISSICAKQYEKEGKSLSTFSVDYENNSKFFKPEKFQPSYDNDYIAIMKDAIHANHNWTVLTPENLIDTLQDATIARDLPGMADVDFSLLAFCGEIRNKVKVALSGECADEIFGGYPWYRDPEVLAKNGFPWAQNTGLRKNFLSRHYAEKISADEFVMDRYSAAIDDCDILPETPEKERRIKQMVNLNQNWFMQTLLDRKDRMSMYHGLEVRVPFCDHRIAEYLYGVPWEYKDYGNQEKGLLRHAASGILPEAVLWRKKSPYPKTYDPKYLSIVRDRLLCIINKKDAPLLQIVRKEALTALLNDDNTWPWYGQLMRTPQTIAYMLQINFWLEHYKVRLV